MRRGFSLDYARRRREARARIYGRPLLTIRASIRDDGLWTAICSGCPLFEIQPTGYRDYSTQVRIHKALHAQSGQVFA